jgi:hypothetical protein
MSITAQNAFLGNSEFVGQPILLALVYLPWHHHITSGATHENSVTQKRPFATGLRVASYA